MNPQISSDEVYDRIDMIYHNSLLNINDFKIIGPDDLSDIKLIDFESDHRAVMQFLALIKYLFKKPKSKRKQ